MTSTVFSSGTVITAPWLNDVNTKTYADTSNTVAYQPAGTGAVLTNVQAKLRESVSVLDFGAGNTDVEINTAITYCLANNKDLFVPSGSYTISAPIVIALNNLGRYFEMYGDVKTDFTCAFVGNMFVVGDASYEGTQLGYGSVKIKNINMVAGATTTSTAIQVRGQKHIHFEDFYISGTWSVGIGMKSVYATPKIINVRINLGNSSGYGIVSHGQVNNILYEGVQFLGCSRGFYASTDSGNGIVTGELDANTFSNCDFEGNVQAILIDSPYGCSALRIINNHFESNTGAEITINNYTSTSVVTVARGITITGNIFLYFNQIKVGNSNSGGQVMGVNFSTNRLVGNITNSLMIGTECASVTSCSYTFGNSFEGTNPNVIEKVVASPLISEPVYEGFGSAMVQYKTAPTLPFGVADTKGMPGDLRWDSKAIYFRTEAAGWTYLPFAYAGTYPITSTTQNRDTAAPTTGAWLRGDTVWNSAPVAGGTIGWVCTTAGTPGTWKTFGAIAA